MITGHATDGKETFEFSIEPFVVRERGFRLFIKYHGDRRGNTTGAGIWPTVEKAKEIAEQSAAKLLHGAAVTWKDVC